MKKRGIGVATMFYPIGVTSSPNPSAAFIKVNRDGTAIVYIGITDVGQGSTTVMAQIAAEELGIEYEDVTVVAGDTKLCPYDQGSVASRVTYIVGNAVQKAAAAAKKTLFEVAAAELRVDSEGLEAKGRRIYVQGLPEKNIALGTVAHRAHLLYGRPPIGSASFAPVITKLDPVTGHGKPYGTYVYATQIAEVEVDTETGDFDVLEIIAVHDCGRAINPLLTEGQIEGGVAMGLGFAMLEEMVVQEGKVLNPQFTDYILPTALDVPDIVTAIVERAEPTGAFGAKGIGEPALLPTAPAIVNAIQNAIGVRLRDLPVTPEKVFRALRDT